MAEQTVGKIVAESKVLIERSKEHLAELEQSHRNTRQVISTLRAHNAEARFAAQEDDSVKL